MRPIMIEMEQMSDSVEVYESRPHPFFAIFIYLIMGILIAAVTFMYFFHIDTKVEAGGMFRQEAKSSEVSSMVSGTVQVCNLEEGKYVSEGEVLVILEDDRIKDELCWYQEQKTKQEEQILLLEAYLKALDGDTEAFFTLTDNAYYAEYLNRYELLQKNMDSANTSYLSQVESCQNTIDSLKANIDYYETSRNKIQQALDAVKNRKNTFVETEIYYYHLVKNYISSYQMTADSYDITVEGMEAEKEKALQSLELEMLTGLEQQLNTAENNLLTIRENLTSAENNLLSAQTESDGGQSEIALLNEKSSVSGALTGYRTQLLETNNTIQTLEKNLEQYELVAQQNGYISMSNEVSEGSYLGQGTVVCEIIPEEQGIYYAEVYISNEDIGNIETGDKVKLEVNSYPATEYGYIYGVIESISKDTKVDSVSGNAYYVAKVSCENTSLLSKDGTYGGVKNGMMSQAGIVTGEKRVLSYVLEMLDLF